MSTKNLLLQSAAILLLSTGVSFAQSPGLGNEDDPDLERPGFVTNADEGVSSEIQAETLADDGSTMADMEMSSELMEWKLSDYHGATVTSDMGDTIGTVEKVTTDSTGQSVYLIVTPSGVETAGEARLVPLSEVAYDAERGGLMLDSASGASIDTMATYDESQSAEYPEITDEDFDFRQAFNFELEGSSEMNSNASDTAPEQ